MDKRIIIAAALIGGIVFLAKRKPAQPEGFNIDVALTDDSGNTVPNN